MIKVLLVTTFFLVLFVVVEVITRKAKLNKELSRKIVHVISGVAVALLPLYLSFYQISVVGLLFIPVLLLSKKKNIFSSIHHVKRQTNGEVYFPIAIVLTAILFQQRYLFTYGILIMALGDGFASIIGQKFGKKTYSLFGSKKSYIGSLTFLIISFSIGIIVLNHQTYISGIEVVIISLVCSLILTFVEGCLSYGLDNLVIAPLAALLIEISTKLIK